MKRSLTGFVLIMLFAGGVLTAAETSPESRLSVKGGRFLTLNTVIRVNQIEAARNLNEGEDEADQQPAGKWEEALPVGNGRLGAMVFGGTAEERLQLNESTLWGGLPHDYSNPQAGQHLAELRRLIFAGKIPEAEKLGDKMLGNPGFQRPYQPLGDLRLRFQGHEKVEQYVRALVLDRAALATTTYRIGGADLYWYCTRDPYKQESPLVPSGLLGPVRLKTEPGTN